MTSSIDVIIQAGAGGRGLLRTVDSVLRQRLAPASVALVKTDRLADAPLVSVCADRLSAIVLEGSPYPGVSMNAAVRSGAGQSFVVLPADLLLDEAFLERCQTEFAEDLVVAAIAPSVTLRAPDGSGELLWMPDVHSVVSILSGTRSVPRVFAVRRQSWEAVSGFDERLEGLVEYAFWLRLASEGFAVRTIARPLVARELDDRSSAGAEEDEDRQRLFRAVLDRYDALVTREMVSVLVSREVRFGRLRQIHRDLLDQRDRDLAELDRIRAEASHQHAYLKHHHRDTLDWGDFRRTNPVSRDWGYDRGTPVDRRYIDDFIFAHSSDVRGSVLEVQEDDFTLACGGRRVTNRAVLDIDPSNQQATVVADLRKAPELGSDAFDCVILTQTLHVIDDIRAALAECYRILRPGGVLLATFPAASRVCLEYGHPGDYWRMTPAGARALVASAFAPSQASCEAFGNVLTNTAFLHGLSTADLTDAEFDQGDPYFPMLTGVRARKSDAASRPGARGVVLLYHRIDDTPDAYGLGVPPAIFETHLQRLQAECQIVELDALLKTAPEDLPPRTVALTFDDGYEDNLRVALPLLQRYDAPATFFLTTRWLEACGEYWWDTLERVLLSQPSVPVSLDLTPAGLPRVVPTGTLQERSAAHRQLHELLVHAPLDIRDRAIDIVKAWSGGGPARVRPVIADEVRHLASHPGVTIGAHSVNHLSLPDNPSSRRAELTDSQEELRRITGHSVDLFAYPYGAIDRETLAMVRRACNWGMSCDERMLADSFDAARVPRLDVKAWTASEFAERISRLFEPPPLRRRALTLSP
jgi:peptidoglycan/xylan/chitin deacetylase (PgdA/CDA1 family)